MSQRPHFTDHSIPPMPPLHNQRCLSAWRYGFRAGFTGMDLAYEHSARDFAQAEYDGFELGRKYALEGATYRCRCGAVHGGEVKP